eukprot:gene22003-biopygen2696
MAAAGGSKRAAASLGSGGQKKTKKMTCKTAPRAGPGPRQSQGSARAEAGQSVGQS